MPAVAIPVIAGVAAGAGSALVVTTATAIAIGTAVASATMMITAKKPNLGDYRSANERSQILRAAASDKSCVYGRVISSGLMSFAAEQAGEQDEGEWLHIALVLAGHKLSRIGDIWLGDDLVATYGALVSYELHADRQTCDPFMLANCADWRSDMIGKGITWLRISCKFDAEKFPAGLPNIKVEKFGKEVWDPRDGKWKWSANAALVILDYYRSWLKVPDDEIRLDEFIQAANLCDERVAIPGGGTEARYTINMEFDLSEPRAKVLEAMHMACAGQPTYVGGKHGILAGAYYGPASDELRAHQLIGDLELLPEPSSSDKINQMAGTFVDPVSFKKTDFPAVIVPEWVEEDGGHPLIEDLDLRCVTSEHQAQRLANIILRQRRNARTLTCSVNLSGWRYRPGQTIKVYVPPMGINGVEFRVTDWSFSLNGGVDLTLREDSPLFWADAIGKPMPRPEITGLPTGGAAMPDLLRYEVETVGEVLQGVLSWRNTGTIAYNQVIIQRLTQGAAPVTVMTAQVPGQSCRVNGLATGNYVALVRTVALTGAHSPVAAVNFVITAPAMPLGVDVEAGNWSLALRPRFAGGHDYGVLCEWWWSHIDHPLGEAMDKANPAGISSYMTLQGLRPDTEYFVWLRAVNAYGKSGLFAASGKTTYDVASILDLLDGEIGAEHLREELRQPIELIPGISEGLSDISEVVADIKPIAERVPELESALADLDTHTKLAENLLRDEQDNLGKMGIDATLQQDKLHGKIDRVQSEVGDLRDAIFTVNPENGQIEMDAVRALRDETKASLTEVNQTLDAVTGTLAAKADHAVVDAQGERLTEAEQVLDGINAALTQTVTKSEFAGEQQRLTEVSNSLNAAQGEILQKAAQSTVTAQGERLAAAEQRITANSDAQSALAERVDGLKAELEGDDQTLLANITEVARVSVEADKALAQRVSGVEIRTDTAEGKIWALEQIVESDGGITAGRFDEIAATLDLTAKAADQAAEAAIANALAGEQGDQRHRQAAAGIRRDQQVQLGLHQALASEVTDLTAKFEGEQADTAARLTVVREVIAGVEQSTAREIGQLTTKTDKTQGEVGALSEAVAEQGKALAARQDDLSAEVDLTGLASIGNTLADEQGEERARKARASITRRQETQADEHQALAREVTQFRAEFSGEQAATSAALTGVREVIAGVEQSTAREISQLKTDYQAAGSKTAAALEESNRTLRAADQAMAERVTQLQATLEGDDQTLNAAILETQRTQAAGDAALADQVTQLQAKVTEGDKTLNAAIQQTQQAQVEGDKANAEAITKVQANLNNTNAAVQSGATATANLRGEVEAGWYTKAKINGEGGGFGLSVKLNADGTTLTSFVVDTDVFAVMSRAAGAASKRHPFIIKNGTVFMNHAMMDTAEIGNVIAKYIKVTNLDAATIVNSDFKGGNAGFGRGGPYSGWGEGWNTIIYADGTIRTNRLYAAEGSFTGEVNANSGTFNNVTIRENCQVLGKLRAEQVQGGFYVKRIYSGLWQPDNADSAWRTAVVVRVSNGMWVSRVIEISASAGHYEVLCKVESSGSSSLTRTATGHYEVRIIRDGATVEYVAPFSISVSATSNPSSGPREERARGGIAVSKTALVPGDGNPHTYAVQFRFVRMGGDGASGSYAIAGCDGNDMTTAQLYISSPDLS
ncbi:phage tail tip protein J-related protein [Aeromonas caviae]|uniref:phage tail tip protein J-related protein n=1 Tax=Aeromonas caviae TaxID=648 RepID=UPI00067AB55D|nr:DUF1983 domain-containing protein [Aeromonas caviae]